MVRRAVTTLSRVLAASLGSYVASERLSAGIATVVPGSGFEAVTAANLLGPLVMAGLAVGSAIASDAARAWIGPLAVGAAGMLLAAR